MTIEKAEDAVTCGGRKEAEWREEKDARPSLGCTALSTIAIQAGQSQIVISVLKSGTLVHLQLIQVHPDLCEIGSNQEENQTLIREQQQLLEKLKKHESEVLSAVEKNQNVNQQREEKVGMDQNKRKKQEEEQEVYKAMTASLKEGWSLLLHLMEKRQEALTLTSDFFGRALEFAESIDRVENLQIVQDNNRLTEVKRKYDSLRRDHLGKSLQVLTSSSILLQKLRQLQRTEALLRRGGVLQDEDDEEECSKSSQEGKGVSLRVEELVEMLQDRRRRADQAIRLHFQQAEEDSRIKTEQESTQTGSQTSDISSSEHNLQFTADDILDQNLQDAPKSDVDLKSKKTIIDQQCAFKSNPESTSNMKSEVRSRSSIMPECKSDLKMENKAELAPESRLCVKPEPKINLKYPSRSDIDSRNNPGKMQDEITSYQKFPTVTTSDVRPLSRSDLNPESQIDLTLVPCSNLNLEFSLNPNHESLPDLKIESTSDSEPESDSELNPDLAAKPETSSDRELGSPANFKTKSTSPTMSDFRSALKDETKSEPVPESRLNLKPNSKADLESKSKTDIKPETKSEFKPEANINLNIQFQPDLQPESKSVLKAKFTSYIKPDSKSDLTSDPWSDLNLEFQSNPKSKFTFDMKPKFASAIKLESRPELQTRPESSSDLKHEFISDQKIESRSTIMPENKESLKSTIKSELEPESRLYLKPDHKTDLKPQPITDIIPEYNSEQKPGTSTDPKIDLTSGLKLDSNLDVKPKFTSNEKSESKSEQKSEPWLNLRFELRSNTKSNSTSDKKPKSASDIKLESKSGLKLKTGSDPKSQSRADLKNEVSSNQKIESTSVITPESRSEFKGEIKSELEPKSTLHLKPQPKTDLKPKFTSDVKPESGLKSETNADLETDFKSDVKLDSNLDLKSKFTSDIKLESKSGLRSKPWSNLKIEFKPIANSTLNVNSKSASDIKLESKPEIKPETESVRKSESGSDLKQGFSSSQKTEFRSAITPESRSKIKDERKSDMEPESRPVGVKLKFKTNITPEIKSELKPNSTVNPKSASDIKLESKPKPKPEIESVQKSESSSELKQEFSSSKKTEFRSAITPESRSEIKYESKSDLEHESRPEDLKLKFKTSITPENKSELKPKTNTDMKIEFRSDLNPESELDLMPKSTSDINLEPNPEDKPEAKSEINLDPSLSVNPETSLNVRLESRVNLKLESTFTVMPDSRSNSNTETKSEHVPESVLYHEPDCKVDQNPKSKTDTTPKCNSELRPQTTTERKNEFRSDMKSESKCILKPKFTSDVKPKSIAILKFETRSDPKLEGLKPKSPSDMKLEFKSDLEHGVKPDLKSETDRKPEYDFELKPDSNTDLIFRSSSLKPEFKSDLKPNATSELKSEPNTEQKQCKAVELIDPQPRFILNLKSASTSDESKNLQPGFEIMEANIPPKHESRSDLSLEFKSDENSNLLVTSKSDKVESMSDLNHDSQSDLWPECISNLKPESWPDLKSRTTQDQIHECQSGSAPDLRFPSEQTRNFNSRDTFSPRPESQSDSDPESISNETQTDTQNLPYESASVASRVKQFECRSQRNSPLGFGQSTNVSHVSKNVKTRTTLKPKSRSNLKLEFTAEETTESGFISDEHSVQSGIRLNNKFGVASDQTGKLSSGFLLAESNNLQPEYRSVESGSRSEQTTDVHSESRSQGTEDLQSRLKLNVKQESTSDNEPGPRPEKAHDLQSVCSAPETNDLKSGSQAELTVGSTSKQKPGSPSQQSPNPESMCASDKTRPEKAHDLQSVCSTPETNNLKSGSQAELTVGSTSKQKPGSPSQQSPNPESMCASDKTRNLTSESRSETEEHHSHQNARSNERQQLLSLCEHLVDKVWSWVQQSSTVLSCNCEAGHQLSEAEDTLKTHLQLRSQAEAAGCDAEKMRQILEQIKTLQTGLASRATAQSPSDSSRQMSELKALTVQLKRGNAEGWSRGSPTQAVPPAAGVLSSELDGRVALVMDDLQTLCRSIESNLQLLQPYVRFLRTAEQVEGDMEELREAFRRRPENEEKDEEEVKTLDISKKSTLKKTGAYWQETMQKLLNAQELGNNYIHTATMVLVSGLNLQSVISVVQRTVERLSRSIQEVNDLQSQHGIQKTQQEEDMKHCRKYREKLHKTLQDLNSVSELLVSCTVMDLGSDPQTSKLLEHFSQARPHFMKLDAEAEFLAEGWETLRGVQGRLGLKEVKEENLSQLLNLHRKVKERIQQSELILDLSSTFHLTTKKLETLLQSGLANVIASTGLNGSDKPEMRRHKEEQEQIQNLFNTASTLKTDICTAISSSGWTRFKVDGLETSLLSLDSLCISWLKEVAQWEEKLQREQLTHQLNNDIKQLRDSFKELKKRFSNLKFNYLKRNDRTRNMKAARNQLQQVEVYEEKLQALRKRLQGVTNRLGSEVKDGGVARETGDAVNELQRQMGEFERNVCEHQKTLNMTCKLQQAMEEYQFWCEEASATIARVGKFSSECRSTEAVSVLYQQFEKFVWPTVPQQEERISQITELAVRLHGAEEGQRYIEKTVSKHSEMVASIRELSDGLMKLEAKLKEKNDKKKEKSEETESRRENETEVKGEEKTKLKENRKLKKKTQVDNCTTQETAEMLELKETGHTPELTNKHDGREMTVKRQSATKRKPPLQKSRSQDSDKQTASLDNRHQGYHESLPPSPRPPSSYRSTHTLSLSSSPMEAGRRVQSVNSQLQLGAPDPQATPLSGPSFSDIQREFQVKEDKEKDTLAEGLTEAELQQHDIMTEDSLSADEYECISPDDISLPPLAETPESIMVQSDVEENVCFSSHGIVQHSHQHLSQHEHSRSRTGSVSGAIRHHRVPSQTESCPTPPTSLPSGTRFISESSSFVQNLPTVPAPTLFTSTLCSMLRTEATCITNIPQSATTAVTCPDSSLLSESRPPCKITTLDGCANKGNLCERRGPSQTEHISREDSRQHELPMRISSAHIKLFKNTVFKNENIPPSNTGCPAEEIDQSNSVLLSSHSAIQASSGPNLQSCQDSRNETDKKQPSNNHTTIVNRQSMSCHSASENYSSDPQIPGSQQNRSPSHSGGGACAVLHAPTSEEPVSVNNSRMCSGSVSSSGSHQTVHSLHESSASTCNQQFVHDPGMIPSSPVKPYAPSQPEAKTQALAQRANSHVTPPSPLPHLLTPDEDPDICQPVAIREEIRLTPQIQGPALAAPLPPPLPKAQAESLPQGKASKSGPTCVSRPLSRATVMEGSPVTLEVEVTGHQEPMLTWSKDGEVSASGRGEALASEDGKHSLLIPEASVGEYETQALGCPQLWQAADNSNSKEDNDRWLVAEVFDIISEEWQTWFGTLCVLLWLLYLIIL